MGQLVNSEVIPFFCFMGSMKHLAGLSYECGKATPSWLWLFWMIPEDKWMYQRCISRAHEDLDLNPREYLKPCILLETASAGLIWRERSFWSGPPLSTLLSLSSGLMYLPCFLETSPVLITSPPLLQSMCFSWFSHFSFTLVVSISNYR